VSYYKNSIPHRKHDAPPLQSLIGQSCSKQYGDNYTQRVSKEGSVLAVGLTTGFQLVTDKCGIWS